MYTENTSQLPEFEQANVLNIVPELFFWFQQSGFWADSMEEYCRRLLRTEVEKNTDQQTAIQKHMTMSEEDIVEEQRQQMTPLGNFTWILKLDEFALEFGLWNHTRIDQYGLIIHAFSLGYGETGRSDDPDIYVIHRTGDEGDYSKVYVVHKKTTFQSGRRRTDWVCEPINDMYQACMQVDMTHAG